MGFLKKGVSYLISHLLKFSGHYTKELFKDGVLIPDLILGMLAIRGEELRINLSHPLF